MTVLHKIVVVSCLAATLSARAQTVRISGDVRAGETFLHPIGRCLSLAVTVDGISVRRVSSGGEGENFARCVTTPVRGPNDLDIEADDFDPSLGKAVGRRRHFHFVLNAHDDEAECTELERAMDPSTAGDNNWYSHPMGRATVTLSQVRLSRPAADPKAELQSFHFNAVVTLPHKR